jgi:hypothetical protein
MATISSPAEIWTTPIRTSTSNGSGVIYNPFVIDTPELWNNVFASASAGTVIHLGVGEYKTYGFALHDYVPGQVEFKTGWNIIGAGRDKTIVKLIQHPALPRYTMCGHSIFGTYYNTPLKNVVIDGMTLDLDMANQSGSRSFNGIQICNANHSVIRDVRIIRWGSDSLEAFPLCIFRGDYIPSVRSSHNIIENCIVERPVRIKSFLSPGGGGFTAIGLVSDYSVVRNCIVDGRWDNGSFSSSFSGNGICAWGKETRMHDNVIKYVAFGGPYTDTGPSNDCIAYNNKYEFVLIACYQNFEGGGVSTNKVVFKNNYIELGHTPEYPWPALAFGTWGNHNTASAYTCDHLEIVDNIIKLHPDFKSTETGNAFYCCGVKNVRVANNVFYLQPNYKPFTTVHCGQVLYSGNFNYKLKP